MLYFIYGNPQKAASKGEELIEKMLAKKPDSEVFRMSGDKWDDGQINEWLSGHSLFTPKYIVQLSRLLEDAEVGKSALKKLKDFQSCDHVFIWIEGDVKKKDLEKIEKVAERVQNFEEIKKSAPRDTDLFDVANAIGERNTKKLWLLCVEKMKKYSPEEVHGTLWWQVKSMAIAVKAKDAKESGLKPFVYNKSKKYAQNYSPEELENLLDAFYTSYHNARAGGLDMETGLEKICLSI